MAKLIREIMTRDPIIVGPETTIAEAARRMRDSDVGAVIVEKNGKVCGIVTDRDITVRVVATKHDPSTAKVGDYCSEQLATLSPGETIDNAVELMRKKAIRRIPVVEGGRAVGIVALGDLALERDPKSALGGISAAQPNL